MDFERFREFMLESAARHESEIAAIRVSLTSMSNTVGRLVDNQVYLQESIDLLTRKMIENEDAREKDRTQAESEMQEIRLEMRALERVVFRHASDPDAHRIN
jgi:hypothetical protein